MDVRAEVLSGLTAAGVDMSAWQDIEVLHLHGRTKSDPLDQCDVLAIKFHEAGKMFGQCVETANDHDFDAVTRRLINGLVRLVNSKGMQELTPGAPIFRTFIRP